MAGVDHRLLDRRSLELHRLVADELRAHPQRLGEVRALLLRWRAALDARTLPAIEEWLALVDAGLEATLEAALELGDEGDRRRQSSPLPCLMAPRARWAFLRAFREAHGSVAS